MLIADDDRTKPMTDNPRWRLEDLDGKYALDFETMTCTVRSEAFANSVPGARESDLLALEEWFADAHKLEELGWTQSEYVERGLASFDIRRSGDGLWEARPKQRYWQRSIDRVRRALEGGFSRDSDREDFKKLTGEDYGAASARGVSVLSRLPAPPWESMGGLVPAVELAYQEYLAARKPA